MNLTDLSKALPVILATGRTPHLIGEAGVGKSSWTRLVLGKTYDNVIDLRIGQISDVAELQGLPHIENGTMNYARPWWMPREGKTLIILDEINRATKDVVQGVFQLVYDKMIGPHILGDNVHVIALSNPPTDSYVVLEFDDEAFQDRFVHIKFEPTRQEFKDYLKLKHGKNAETMLKFLEIQPDLVMSRSADNISLEFVKGSNRSTDYFITLSSQRLEESILKELAYGILGLTATVSFFNFKKEQDMLVVTAEEVIEDYNKAKRKIMKATEGDDTKRYDMQLRIIEGILDFMKKRHDEGIKAHEENKEKAIELRIGELKQVEHDNLLPYYLDLPNDLFIALCKESFKYECFYCTAEREVMKGLAYDLNNARGKELFKKIDDLYKNGQKITDLIPNQIQLGTTEVNTNV
jgi:hypothetical protein